MLIISAVCMAAKTNKFIHGNTIRQQRGLWMIGGTYSTCSCSFVFLLPYCIRMPMHSYILVLILLLIGIVIAVVIAVVIDVVINVVTSVGSVSSCS